MTDAEFNELIAGGERHGVEFKRGFARVDRGPRFCRVVRAVLGMSNRRDGGLVVIGVEDDGTPAGLSDDELNTWNDRDSLRGAIAPYADPFVDFELEAKTFGDGALAGRHFVILHVRQFDQVPVLCASGCADGRDAILKVGALYVRSRERVETVEVSTQAQMRELVDLAVDRGIRAWLSRNQAAGITLQFHPAADADAAFALERADFDED
jgi:predicted HTH transcriptional regulator